MGTFVLDASGMFALAEFWAFVFHPLAVPFPLTPFYLSLSQSILYWSKFLLILATILDPHRSLLFQSLPKHPILTEVPSNPCDHDTQQIQVDGYILVDTPYLQKFLKQCPFLWLPSIPVPPKASYTDRSSVASNPCDHNGPTSEPKVPSNRCDHNDSTLEPNYTDRSSF